MVKVARILDIKNNRIIGKLYKGENGLLAKPEVDGDSGLPTVYYYNKKVYDKIELAFELDVIDELEITEELVSEIENIFNCRYEVIRVSELK